MQEEDPCFRVFDGLDKPSSYQYDDLYDSGTLEIMNKHTDIS